MKEKTESQRVFLRMVHDAGYDTMKEFAEYVGIDQSNIRKNIRGEERVQLARIFKYANALAVDVIELLWLFYGEEMEENKDTVMAKLSMEGFFD